MLDSSFPQPLSRSFLVFLLVWNPLLHTPGPYISSPSHHLHFITHAHTITACFSVIPLVCHLFLISLSAPYLEICLLAWCYTSTWPFSSLLTEVPPHFLSLQARSHIQHTVSHTTAVQPSSHNQWYVFIGKQWYQLPELIPTNSAGPYASLHLAPDR